MAVFIIRAVSILDKIVWRLLTVEMTRRKHEKSSDQNSFNLTSFLGLGISMDERIILNANDDGVVEHYCHPKDKVEVKTI